MGVEEPKKADLRNVSDRVVGLRVRVEVIGGKVGGDSPGDLFASLFAGSSLPSAVVYERLIGPGAISVGDLVARVEDLVGGDL